jgi:prepilin-type N-terminal cleavage/methylation domain-containing protein
MTHPEEEKYRQMRTQKGFSLIELLIVVAIILIIAAIAIPNLLRARISANEASAVGSIRTINSSNMTYVSTFPTVGYAPTLAALGPTAVTGCTTPSSTNACLLDWVLAQANAPAKAKSGYYFNLTPAVGGTVYTDYTVGSGPAAPNQSGVRSFCSNSDGVIRFLSTSATPVTTTAACLAYTALQ